VLLTLIGYWNVRPSSKTTKNPTETKGGDGGVGVGDAVVVVVVADS